MSQASALLASFNQLARDHTWLNWALALVVAAAGTALLMASRATLHRRLVRLAARTDTRLDDLLADLVGATKRIFLVALATLGALQLVELPPRAERAARGMALLVCLLQAGLWSSRAAREIIERRFAATEPDDLARRTVTSMVALGVRVLLWAILLILALDNLGIDVTALVAGLGVGGVAVALALQNVLGDLFASVSILLDKPFVPGDFIIVDDLMGTVEHIGVKTTRIRSLGGEQLVFANNDLLKSRVRNFKRMQERRVVFRVGVTYQTPVPKLERIPAMLRGIVETQPGTRFDRAHFVSCGDFALLFEVVYYVLDPDYNRYMDVQQAMNLAICRSFEGDGIEFAYPTQTLFVQTLAGQPRS